MIKRLALLLAIKQQYKLDWEGTHGVNHWTRVHENGILIQSADIDAFRPIASPVVLELFSLLHDSCRLNEWEDDGHGRRGADYAATLRGEYFDISDSEFDLLYHAIDKHSDGLLDGDITVRTCWDADRLDLGRVGITPHPHYLCTYAGKLAAIKLSQKL